MKIELSAPGVRTSVSLLSCRSFLTYTNFADVISNTNFADVISNKKPPHHRAGKCPCESKQAF